MSSLSRLDLRELLALSVVSWVGNGSWERRRVLVLLEMLFDHELLLLPYHLAADLGAAIGVLAGLSAVVGFKHIPILLQKLAQ